MGPRELLENLEDISCLRLKGAKLGDGCLLVRCRSECDQEVILGLDGACMGSRKLRITRAEVPMDITEAFAYLKRKLACIEESKRCDPIESPQVFSISKKGASSECLSTQGFTSRVQDRPAQTRGHGQGKGERPVPMAYWYPPPNARTAAPHQFVGPNPTGFASRPFAPKCPVAFPSLTP
jgi:hypothetical protein